MVMSGNRMKVAILGATGIVGQRFVQLLHAHPWFEIASLAASEQSVGKTYDEACRWRLSNPMPELLRSMRMERIHPEFEARLVFSALESSVAGQVEEDFARAGYAVVSNASSHRMDSDVPLLIPEINAEHLDLIGLQRKNRGYNRGFVVTNPNCSTIILALALAPLERDFSVDLVCVSTSQAASGGGYPGISSLDLLGNVIPYIRDEEEKIETETRRIFGQYRNGSVRFHPMLVTAQATRVPVVDGHTGLVSVKLRTKASLDDVTQSLREYRSLPQQLNLPSAPKFSVILKEEVDRPQPRLDVDLENGMACIVGRVRKCPIFGFKFVMLGHNTIRGAAGAAILNAELLKAQGYLD